MVDLSPMTPQRRLDQQRFALARFIMDNKHPLRILGGTISFVGLHGDVSREIVTAVDAAVSLQLAKLNIAKLLKKLSTEWDGVEVPVTPLPPLTEVEGERERCARLCEQYGQSELAVVIRQG